VDISHMRRAAFSALTLVAALIESEKSFAQRAADNALAAAEDAFGTSVGNESIGLYSSGSARGFSPTQAGNIRIEGLYFDQAAGLGTQLVRGSTLRVGLSAQAYPFPSPTGIVDYRLRLPNEKTIHSAVVGAGPFNGTSFDLVSQVPLVASRLGMVAGASVKYDAHTDFATNSLTWAGSALLNWTPRDNIQITPFWGRSETSDEENRPGIYTAGSYLPPAFHRRPYYAPEWADGKSRNTNFGVVSAVAPAPGWTVRFGAFRSLATVQENYVISLRDTQPDGSGRIDALADPPRFSGSYSGELRVSRRFVEGDRAHTIYVSLRARDSRRTFGGGDRKDLGAGMVGVDRALPEPVFTFGPQRKDVVKQGTAGLSYTVNWLEVGEFSAGVQKSRYKRSLMPVGGAGLTETTSRPWLYNATIAISASPSLVFYGGYTRGLEASGIAPDSATNRGEALPASITRQADAGIRYALSPQLRAVVGVFEISKPFLDRDANNLFQPVGRIRNRGIEASISGEPLPGLTVVAGAVLLKARISGFTVDQGTIGEVPISTFPRVLTLNMQYGPASWMGISIDADIENGADHFADRLNTFKIPGATTLNIGGRYRFKLGESPATLRLRVQNVTNNYDWHVHADWFHPVGQRRYTAQMSVDF